MERRRLLDPTTLWHPSRWPGVSGDEIDPVNGHPPGAGRDGDDAALFASIVTGADDHEVTAADVEGGGGLSHTTSFASETILTNPRKRSSRATGPNTRVPFGVPSALTSTTALSSKRTVLPSGRW